MKRAIGVVRVSQRNGREDDAFHSPTTQRTRIEDFCAQHDWKLIDVFEEIDVSGKRPLAKRPGLSAAIDAIEGRDADHIVVAYLDRLVRSIAVQAEATGRVERAGGEIYALDHGRLTNGSAAQKMSANVLGAMAQYFADVTAEKSGDAQAIAVAQGKVPWSSPTPGYRRGDDGRLVAVPEQAAAVLEAFKLRDRGATIFEVRDLLAERGIRRSYGGVTALLSSRVVLGEIHFGRLHNTEAHPPIVPRDLWNRVQQMVVPRGRRATSDRLLARLGVLRCGSCATPMVVGSGGTYRCPATVPCPRKTSVEAHNIEDMVVAALRAHESPEGRASVEQYRRAAEAALADAQTKLAAVVRILTGLEDEAAARDRIAELTEVRDGRAADLERLGPDPRGKRVGIDDWEHLSLAARRDLVRATVDAVTVAPATSRRWDPGRVAIKFFGE